MPGPGHEASSDNEEEEEENPEVDWEEANGPSASQALADGDDASDNEELPPLEEDPEPPEDVARMERG